MERPDHPDFWLMSEAIIDLDTASDSGVAFEQVIGNIDMESLAYIAQQRSMRASKILAQPVPREMQVAASWLDGFMAGARFHELKQKKSQEGS